jgi:hypothetical protein
VHGASCEKDKTIFHFKNDYEAWELCQSTNRLEHAVRLTHAACYEPGGYFEKAIFQLTVNDPNMWCYELRSDFQEAIRLNQSDYIWTKVGYLWTKSRSGKFGFMTSGLRQAA